MKYLVEGPRKVGRPRGATFEALNGRAVLAPLKAAAALAAQTGARIRQSRLDANISQAELAAAMGVGKDTVSKIEKGVNLKIVRLWQVALALGVPVEHLIGGNA